MQVPLQSQPDLLLTEPQEKVVVVRGDHKSRHKNTNATDQSERLVDHLSGTTPSPSSTQQLFEAFGREKKLCD